MTFQNRNLQTKQVLVVYLLVIVQGHSISNMVGTSGDICHFLKLQFANVAVLFCVWILSLCGVLRFCLIVHLRVISYLAEWYTIIATISDTFPSHLHFCHHLRLANTKPIPFADTSTQIVQYNWPMGTCTLFRFDDRIAS